ncbi:MAG: V-type ATP synthase subunit F [Tissierellia bacterium]|nr:V-type ATP synthase subunit F [Tissierellia bacterium]
MYRVAILGDRESVLAFQALGLEIYSPHGADETRDTLDRLGREEVGVIFITEQLAALIPETIARYDEGLTPAVILVPSGAGSLGIGMEKINRNVEKAVGSNIL